MSAMVKKSSSGERLNVPFNGIDSIFHFLHERSLFASTVQISPTDN